MQRTAVIAAVAAAAVVSAGCGSSSVSDLAKSKLGATSCSKAGLAEIAGASRDVYSCQREGGFVYVFKQGGSLYELTCDQAQQVGFTC